MKFAKIIALLFFALICEMSRGEDAQKNDTLYLVMQDPEKSVLGDNFYISCKEQEQSNPFHQLNSKSSPVHITKQDVLKALVYQQAFCMQRYKLSSQQVLQLLQSKYDEIVKNLIQLDHLTDEGIVELYELYKAGCFRQNKVSKYDTVLQKALQGRATLKKEQLEKQKQYIQLQKVYEQANTNSCGYISGHQQDRDQALQKTKEQAYVQTVKDYDIEVEIAALLDSHGVEHKQYQRLSGTVLQHQLFGEIVDCYKKVAQACFKIGLENSDLAGLVVAYGHAAFVATDVEMFLQAYELTNIAELLAETTVSIFKGQVKAVCNLVDMGLHPKETAKQLGMMIAQVLQTLGGAVVLYDHDTVIPVCHRHASQVMFNRDVKKLNVTGAAIRAEFAKKSLQEKIESASEFVCDGILQAKFFSAIGSAFGKTIRYVKSVEIVGSMTEALNSVGNIILDPKKSLSTVAGQIEYSLFNMMESESNKVFKALASAEIWSIATIQQQIRFFANKIPLSETELLANLRYVVENGLAQANVKICQTVRDSFVSIERMVGDLLMNIEIDIDHIMNFGYKIVEDKTCSFAEFWLDGGHLAGSARALEKAGLLIIKEEYSLAHGCQGYLAECVITGKIIYKTEFSALWDAQKIMETIVKSFDNIIDIAISKNNKRWVVRTQLEDGLKLKIIIDKVDTGYKLVTAMPIFE